MRWHKALIKVSIKLRAERGLEQGEKWRTRKKIIAKIKISPIGRRAGETHNEHRKRLIDLRRKIREVTESFKTEQLLTAKMTDF